jgi:hypothetical protein
VADDPEVSKWSAAAGGSKKRLQSLLQEKKTLPHGSPPHELWGSFLQLFLSNTWLFSK